MGKLTKAQHVRLFLGRAVYYAMWAPAVAMALPFVLIQYAFEFLAETAFPALARLFRPPFAWWHTVALGTGNAVFGKSGRSALNAQGADQ
jgi:hypothetical protein